MATELTVDGTKDIDADDRIVMLMKEVRDLRDLGNKYHNLKYEEEDLGVPNTETDKAMRRAYDTAKEKAAELGMALMNSIYSIGHKSTDIEVTGITVKFKHTITREYISYLKSKDMEKGSS